MVKNKIGLTTTVPVEIIFAAGQIPIDLNNLFITDQNPNKLVKEAEFYGFGTNVCSWIKGLFSTALKYNIKKIVGVTEGDCSNTHALMDIYNFNNIKVIPFGFPHSRKYNDLKQSLENFMEQFNVTYQEVNRIKALLDPLRKKIKKIDDLTWQENKVSGFENHIYQVTASDFEGNFAAYEKKIDFFLKELSRRKPLFDIETIRLGILGVPTIYSDLYDVIERNGGQVVFNEVQRQFAMPLAEEKDIVDQYLTYTYPYNVYARLADIKTEVKKRNIKGLIHYVQSFCYRQMHDVILKKELDIPILTLEGDLPGKLDVRGHLKIETFLEMLR